MRGVFERGSNGNELNWNVTINQVDILLLPHYANKTLSGRTPFFLSTPLRALLTRVFRIRAREDALRVIVRSKRDDEQSPVTQVAPRRCSRAHSIARHWIARHKKSIHESKVNIEKISAYDVVDKSEARGARKRKLLMQCSPLTTHDSNDVKKKMLMVIGLSYHLVTTRIYCCCCCSTAAEDF